MEIWEEDGPAAILHSTSSVCLVSNLMHSLQVGTKESESSVLSGGMARLMDRYQPEVFHPQLFSENCLFVGARALAQR